YNDWGTMGSMVLLTLKTVEKLGVDFDFTIIDDGSEKQTLALLDDIEATFPNVAVKRHETNRGYGGALRSGFQSGTKEWIFYTDGDAQYDVRELALLVEKAAPDVDVVQGYKIQRHDPLHRIVIGKMYHKFVRTLFGLKIRDTDCDFRLIRRTVFDKFELKHNSGVICAEMMMRITRAGCRIVEVPVHHYQRAHGKSQFFNFPRLFRVAMNLGSLWYHEVLMERFRKSSNKK
ncbi:MAG TPA: glycosyltransferase family 2 protein, partial [Candidatus Hydrogenedentes bacterium]|nr:glycosyltransferase family 2 protein [Candidatus Hydrogenedentota bacterium]